MSILDPSSAPRRILVPLDGSSRAESILPRIVGLARACGATVVLLRVNPTADVFRVPAEPGLAFATRGTIAPPEDQRNVVYEAEHYLDAVVDRLRQSGVTVDAKVAEGAPGEVIVGEAEASEADLIAMTTHGRTGLGRLVLGSVADHVLRHANRPVYLLRAA